MISVASANVRKNTLSDGWKSETFEVFAIKITQVL